jgi:hypothetical protein
MSDRSSHRHPRFTRRTALTGLAGLAFAGAGATTATAATAGSGAYAAPSSEAAGRGRGRAIRFATFNASLNRGTQGALVEDLSTGDNAQAQNVAEIIQRVNPDVLLINEFDYDETGEALRLFQRNYLSVAHNGSMPRHFPYSFTAPSNTGVASGVDLDGKNGAVTVPGSDAYGQDAYGYGWFPGQYGMAVLSTYPLDTRAARTFQHFLWKDMPDNAMPEGYYSDEAVAVLRLSSKSHWDLPVRVGPGSKGRVHFLVSHPTPPTFDGTEDRNGRRNHDEIRFWADYIGGRERGAYIYDDKGGRGGLRPGSRFVIAGDLNADPHDGDSYDHAVLQLLDHEAVRLPATPPSSTGGVEAAQLQGGANTTHTGNPAYDTADFGDTAPGNLRVDHVIPSKGLIPGENGIFWPPGSSPLHRLTGDGSTPVPSSDHRMVWQDVFLG